MYQIKIPTIALFKKAILLLGALVFVFISFAQNTGKNLVPNPGFEIHKNKTNIIKNAIPWQNQGTVDYYLKGDKRDTTPFKGPHSGLAYAGLRFQANYKEYMYVKLTEQLVKGNKYHFTMYVRLLNLSNVSVKQLGVYFSDDPFLVGMSFDEEGLVDSTYKKGISGTLAWIPISGDYLAKGGEDHIIIGNFKTVMKDDFVRKNKWEIFEMREAYYYVDDISVIAPEKIIVPKVEEKKVPSTLPKSFAKGDVIQMKNIQFKPNSAFFTKESYAALDDLINTLNQHPYMVIQINGHTDDVGNAGANLKLSKERAKAVYSYLSDQVLNPIKFAGYGSSKPLVPNDSEANRAKNRRVEFVVIKP